MSRDRHEQKSIFGKTRLPLIALAALPLTVGAVLAQTTGTAQPGTASADATAQAQPQRVPPAQPGQRQNQQNQNSQGTPTTRPQGSGTNYADVFLQKLAAQLGVSVTRLRAATLAAGNATIDQGVTAGDIPGDRAADLKTRLQNNPFGMFGGRGGPGGPGGRGMHGPGQPDQNGPRGQTDDGGAAVEGAITGS